MITLYNTLSRKVEEFNPIQAGKAGVYACGPTVYNYAHIGNLRTYVFVDLLRRSLRFLGYDLTLVMNVTDVGHLTDDADSGEDKMMLGAKRTGKSVWEIAEFYTQKFFEDTRHLNIEDPDILCKATDHIGDMIALIRRLEARGHTYTAGGNVYFDISTFPDYGRLALRDRQELKAGARTEIDAHKKNPHDFVLWFTRSKFEHQAMVWDSPWGRGYPGWHIECSAMSMKYLGEQFDIHIGGIDHIPVHHTNEIAQSEAATGKKWVNYWLHTEFLVMQKDKLSKSSGNFLTLKDVTDRAYHPLDFRYFCLGAHYRSQLQFSFDGLSGARSARSNLLEKVRDIARDCGNEAADGMQHSAGAAAEKEKRIMERFKGFLSDDINIPRSLALVWDVLKEAALSSREKLACIRSMDQVLSIGMTEAADKAEAAAGEALDDTLLSLIRERDKARKDKDFARADEIRGQLLKRGIKLEDGPHGTQWKKVPPVL
jgi:cysteinyl-tRNA synthetase